MKKLVPVFVLAVVAMMFTVGCGSNAKCDECGEMRFCETYDRMDGKKFTYCESCAEKMDKEFQEAFGVCDGCGKKHYCDTYEKSIDGKEVLKFTYCEQCAEKNKNEVVEALQESSDEIDALED